MIKCDDTLLLYVVTVIQVIDDDMVLKVACFSVYSNTSHSSLHGHARCKTVTFNQVLHTCKLIVSIVQGDKYKEKEPDAVDMFKECHFSRKKGYTPDVQLLVVS